MSRRPASAASESCPTWCIVRHGEPVGEPVVHIGGALLVGRTVLRLCTTIDTASGTQDGPYVLVGDAEYTLHEAEALLPALIQLVDEGRGGRVRARRAEENGAAAVEFALVAMLLFTLLFGILQFGLWFWCWQTGAHAAREAARFAAVEPCDDAGIAGKATAALDGAPITGPAPTVNVTTPPDVRVGDEITVSVHFTTTDLGFFPGFDGVIDKSATSRVENVPAGGC